VFDLWTDCCIITWIAGVAWGVWQAWLAADSSTGCGTGHNWCSIQHTST